MKITNFRPHETEPNFAYVDVECPWWRFKAKQTKIVFKPAESCFWRWLDSGEYVPESYIENQRMVYLARKQLGINTNHQG